MRTPKVIETWGAIQTEERLSSVQLTGAENVMAFQSMNPFPGYFENNQFGGIYSTPVYLITAKKYIAEDLALSLKKLSKITYKHCSADFGYVEMDSEKFYSIRIKNTSCLKKIDLFVDFLSEEGIECMKYRPLEGDAFIKTYRNFSLKEINDYHFKDMLDEEKVYLKVPFHLCWSDFKQITRRVKMQMNNHFFDGAQVIIWNADGPSNLIRIFEPNMNRIRLKIIYELYMKESKIWLENKSSLGQSEAVDSSSDTSEMYY